MTVRLWPRWGGGRSSDGEAVAWGRVEDGAVIVRLLVPELGAWSVHPILGRNSCPSSGQAKA